MTRRNEIMACFLAPLAEAIVTTAVTRAMQKKEAAGAQATDTRSTALPFSRKLKWLSNLLWGGSALLAFEHLWHGEISPVFPFLTAMQNPADTAAMLQELGTVGVAMAALITAVWLGMVAVSHRLEQRSGDAATEAE